MVSLKYYCTLRDENGEEFSYFEETTHENIVRISDNYEMEYNAYWDIDILTEDLNTGKYTIYDMPIEAARLMRQTYTEEWYAEYKTAYQVVTDFLANNK